MYIFKIHYQNAMSDKTGSNIHEETIGLAHEHYKEMVLFLLFVYIGCFVLNIYYFSKFTLRGTCLV